MPPTRTNQTARRFLPARLRLLGAAIIAGGVLLVVGAYQPWHLESSNDFCIAYEQTGIDNGGGKITMSLAAGAMVLGLLLALGIRPRLTATTTLVLFVFGALFIGYEWWIGRLILFCPPQAAGIGLYVSWAGTAVGTLGSIGALSPRFVTR